MLEFARSFVRRFDPRWSFFQGLPIQGRVLEIGCGRGDNCAALRLIRPQWEICGLDVLPASEVPPFIAYVQHNLEVTPLPYPDAHFDAILFVHVIEHLRQPAGLNGEIKRLLRSGGQLYIETPNYTSIFAPSFSLRRDQHYPFNFFDDQEHVKPYSKQSLYEFIENCGLRDIRTGNTRNWLRIPSDLVGLPVALLSGDRRQAVRHFWNLYGWCIYGVGTKL